MPEINWTKKALKQLYGLPQKEGNKSVSQRFGLACLTTELKADKNIAKSRQQMTTDLVCRGSKE